MLHYHECLPHPALRNIIHLYGVMGDFEAYATEQIQTTPPVINKGLMFHYRRDHSLQVENGHFRAELPLGFILPQGTKPNVWKYKGGFGIFSVIFKPGKFRLLYKDSMLEFLNYPLTFVDYNDKSLLELHDRIMTAKNHQERIRAVDNHYLEKIKHLDLRTDWLQNAWNTMYLNPQYKIAEIRKNAYKSESQFRKRFSRAFGISPKQLQLLMRMTHAVNLINSKKEESLTSIAHKCGFSDQSHFIHQFKSNTGLTPSAFQQIQQNMTKLINHHEVE